ncbi:MAG: DUF3822 family protein [Saprospiraceae bacterium]|nr:DUF3822 family protein [Saprospiraceae bacterium]
MEHCLFHFQIEHLNAAQTASGQLNLVAGVDSLSLLALSKDAEVLALQYWQLPEKKTDQPWFESQLPALLADLELLQMPFLSCKCVALSEFVTLIPTRLYHAEELEKYFKLLKPAPEGMKWGSESLPDFGCQVVYGLEPHFQNIKSQCEVNHLATSLIPAFQLRANSAGKSVFLNIRGKLAQIAVFDAQSLLFFNTFDFWKPADLLYFVLLAYDQFKLNPESDPLSACGSFLEDSEYYKMLHRYIRHIRFLENTLPKGWPDQTGTLKPHCWFDLLSL